MGRMTRGGLGGLMGWGVLVVALVFSSGCSTIRSSETLDGSQGEEDQEQLELDPMLIRAGVDGEEGETLDAGEVFERAYEAYSERRYEEAIQHYELVIEYFDDSKYYMPAQYNAGLSYEKLEQWEAAARHYERIVAESPDEKDGKDAFYRLAATYEKLDEHQRVVELMTEVMLRDEVSNFDRIEAHLRRSNAHLELENWKEAEQGYRELLELNEEAKPAERLAADSHLIVQAHFGLGRSYHERVREISLVLPTERMGEDLEEKARLFTTAQANYIEALRHHHPQWSTAAGYMIGKLYEDFYTDIFNAEIPDDLDEEHIALYFEELRQQIRPLMDRAISVYEKNLSLSRRLGRSKQQNEWAAQSADKLEKLQHFLDDPVTQRRAEKLVVEGRTISSPWDPQEAAVDLVDVAVQEAMEEAYDESAEELRPDEHKGPES